MNIRNAVLRPPHTTAGIDLAMSDPNEQKPRRGGHGWMMAAMCAPMLAIGIVLVATDVVGGSFLFLGVGCVLMMVLMMRGMDLGGDRSVHHQSPPPPPPRVR